MRPFRPWRIVHVDLADGIPELERDDTHDAALIVFWYGDLALGEARVGHAALPITRAQMAEHAARAIAPAVGDWTIGRGFEAPLPASAALNESRHEAASLAALTALGRPLATLPAALRARTRAGTRPRLTVVVCTRDRPEALAKCLRGLQASTEPPDEIVVVDNAPRTDAARQVVEREPGVVYVAEPRPGLSCARNAGLKAAGSELVGFTDDDVVVHPTWTARVRDVMSDPSVTASTGLVLPMELSTPSQVYFETVFGGFAQGYRRRVFDSAFFDDMRAYGAPVWSIGAGANMAFRREVFGEVGGFDERLGAGASGCSEDSEMWYRLLSAGRACVYDPRPVVFHYHRSDWPGLEQQMRLYMQGHVAALLVQYANHGDRGNLWRLVRILPGYYAMRFLRRLRRAPGSVPSTLGSEVLGALQGLRYYAAHRRDCGAPALE